MEAFAIHGREEISREELIKEFHKRGIPIRKLSKEELKDVLGDSIITKEVLEEFNLDLQ